VSNVLKFENDLYNELEKEASVLKSIENEKQITPEAEKKLIEIIKQIEEIHKK
jgi:F0F1-type ATP synthase alpha subunit